MKLSALLYLLSAPLFAAPALSQDSICSRFAGTPLLAPQPAYIEGASSHIYKSVGNADLRLHVFSGDKPGIRPAVVFYFGGGWNWGDVSFFREQAEHFAALGMRSVLVEYRTFCRQGVSVADEVEDAKSAIRWLRINAGELGIDPSAIAASGASSGGHLALSTAMFEEKDNPAENLAISSKPNLLLLFYPCVDLTDETEMVSSSEVIGTQGYELSPLFHIPRDLPPLIIFQGTADPLHASVKRFCDDAKFLGHHCEFLEYAGAGHGYLNQRFAEEVSWTEATVGEMEMFLLNVDYLGRE